ncbi:hypothetical protein [Streptomyces camelliae]|uniref:Integral membrane protein n=1 Tax=Streptomyces camelliae TaxID=3004093 RepID=A0ABY7PHU4_9ACTN|nr:hypothetical protein [Streptomyces sp. HUAS 2-6]WBO68998.1 hypothetical protein O1G22_42655 [Streptomyces sp. HUAS 2-6]
MALAVPASAMLTAIAFGLVYGASLTPVGWRNTFVMGFVGVVLVGGLIGLAFVLYDFRTENTEESARIREIAVAVCVAVTMFVGWIVLKDQALHERGRPVPAVVTALQGSASPFDAGTEAILADASHHQPLGAIGAGDLAVGDHITVTVDPRGRYGVSAGPPPANPEWLWTLSALIAVVQALLVASIGFSAARAREHWPAWKRLTEPSL